MKETEYFQEQVDRAAEIEIDIKTVYNQRLKDCQKMFKYAFGADANEFNTIRDMLFYTTGVPKESSKSKLETLMGNVIVVIKWFTYLGKKDELDRIFGNHGITIEIKEDELVKDSNPQKFRDIWDHVFPGKQRPDNNVELLQVILDESIKNKSAILTLKKEIDEEIVDDINTKCDITKGSFKKAVTIRVKQLNGKDATDNIKKLEKDIDDLNAVVELLE